MQAACFGEPIRSLANFVQHQLDLIDAALFDIARRGGGLLLKVLQNISRVLVDLCHNELALVYALAAMRLCAPEPPRKAGYLAALAAHRANQASAVLGIVRQARARSPICHAWLLCSL